MAFGHLEITYDARVLTPRPWTQAQSAWAAERLAELPSGDVLELCSGAGHIGLLSLAGTSRHLVQVDASEAACELARANAARAAEVDGGRWTVEVRHGRLEQALRPEEQFVLVIADPPWVPAQETHRHPEDPLSAIDGGHDGLDLVRSSLTVIGRHLTDTGEALLQVGDLAQAEAVERYVDARPHLGLRTVDHRVLDRGTLVHLVRKG
jgi:release factor glutamine methyltransferase